MYTEKELSTYLTEKRLKETSLRALADQFGDPITYADIHHALHGKFPKSTKKRAALGLPPYSSVVVVEGNVPNGTQVLCADLCACGQWYIKNHPRRRKCFSCSPCKKRL